MAKISKRSKKIITIGALHSMVFLGLVPLIAKGWGSTLVVVATILITFVIMFGKFQFRRS